MQSPIRTFLYGLGIWFIWVTLVVVLFEVLPTDLATSAFFVAMKFVTLVVFVLSFTILYLRKVRVSSFTEGLLLGLSWTAIIIVLDLAHYFMVPFDIAAYLTTVVPAYIIIPIITTLVLGYLEQKPNFVVKKGVIHHDA